MINTANGLKLPEVLEAEDRPEIELYRTGSRNDAAELQALIAPNWEYLHEFNHLSEAEPTVEAIEKATAKTVVAMAEGSEAQYLITFQKDLVGRVGLADINCEANTAKLSYWVGAQFQRQGIARAAASRLVRFGFKDLGLETIRVRVHRENKASESVARALGAHLTDLTDIETNKGRSIEYRRWELQAADE